MEKNQSDYHICNILIQSVPTILIWGYDWGWITGFMFLHTIPCLASTVVSPAFAIVSVLGSCQVVADGRSCGRNRLPILISSEPTYTLHLRDWLGNLSSSFLRKSRSWAISICYLFSSWEKGTITVNVLYSLRIPRTMANCFLDP